MKLTLPVTLASFALLLIPGNQCATAATVHDLDTDYSTSNNPNGVWSYGYFASDRSVFHRR